MRLNNSPQYLILSFGIALVFNGLFLTTIAASQNLTLGHKLAILHARSNSGQPLQSSKKIPSLSEIAEFNTIINSLKNRCTNPDTTIADSLVESWQVLIQNGVKVSLLDVAQQITAATKNTSLFGYKKVNCRMTSKVWLTSQLTGEDLRTLWEAGGY